MFYECFLGSIGMMLSEPRRKRTRITDDPNNLRWAKDNEKIGQKLLEKMGWRSGAGLGAKEQGRTNPLAMNSNPGLRGLGCESKTDVDVHSEHRRNFDSLLSSLRQSGSNSNPTAASADGSIVQQPCSLTSLSKSSRRRIHYSRFAKGKELSTASAIDLATVTGDLGKRTVASTSFAGEPSLSNIAAFANDEEEEKKSDGAPPKKFVKQAFVKSRTN